jgi:hypothetical protein
MQKALGWAKPPTRYHVIAAQRAGLQAVAFKRPSGETAYRAQPVS